MNRMQISLKREQAFLHFNNNKKTVGESGDYGEKNEPLGSKNMTTSLEY